VSFTKPIPLEDDFNDILNKAISGLRLTDRELAKRSGVSVEIIHGLCRGQLDETSLPRIAPHLNLDPQALLRSALKLYRPRPVEMEGLEMFTTSYRGAMTVNCFLIWDPSSRQAAIFDTGTDALPIVDRVAELGFTPVAVFLTHTHPDHVAEADALRRRLGVPVRSSVKEPWPGAEVFEPGARFAIGQLSVETRATWGHSTGGTTYLITGLEEPVAVVGDALFAGSMGGGMVSYADALRTNREEIFSLPDDAVICPGHGPMTTVGQEKRHNPFFPEFKAS
jgi:glyoxylase-like metal-dependent hydrolase (beta-lactamase superfamily II)